MAKIKDLTPSMHIKTAESELSLPFGTTEMAQSTGGLSMFSNAFKRGSGAKIFGNDENGIWLGAPDYPDAPFRVDYDGHVIANSADFSAAGYTKLTIFQQDDIPVSVSTGDLWFDTNDTPTFYRAASVGANEIITGEWEEVVTTATVFAQDDIPTSIAKNDIWYDTNDGNKMYLAGGAGANSIATGEWEYVVDLRAADAILKSVSGQTLTGDFLVGDANIKIDGPNKRIIISDGTNDRILIGYQLNGF